MPSIVKRLKARKEPETTVARLQDLAKEQADRLGPYADQARDQAAVRVLQARGWTAPRLDNAALRVEDTVAPRVADLLSTAARRVEPEPPARKRGFLRRGNRRVPRGLLIGGAAVVGGVVVYSLIRLRQASQDAEWQQHLDQARDQVRETKENLEEKASAGAEKMADTAKATKAKAKETVQPGASGDRAKNNAKPGN